MASTSTENHAARASARRGTSRKLAASPSTAQIASGKRPAHSCRPRAWKPAAIEVNGSSPRPSSLRVGTSLFEPSTARPWLPKRLSAMRRDNSATSRSGGSQMPLAARGMNRLRAAIATAIQARKWRSRRGRALGEPDFCGVSWAPGALVPEAPAFSSLIAAQRGPSWCCLSLQPGRNGGRCARRARSIGSVTPSPRLASTPAHAPPSDSKNHLCVLEPLPS